VEKIKRVRSFGRLKRTNIMNSEELTTSYRRSSAGVRVRGRK